MSKTGHILQPFELSDEHSYLRWREWKLADYPRSAQELLVAVANPMQLSTDEHHRILACCRKANMAFYEIPAALSGSKEAIRMLGHQFGLDRLDMNLQADEDSITSLRAMPDFPVARF